MIVAVHLHDTRAVLHVNVGGVLNLLHKVLRHGGAQRLSAHQHDYTARELGVRHRGLTGGIGAAR